MPIDEDLLPVGGQDEDEPSDVINQAAVETNATIVHVVDGDTFDAELDDVGKVRIRMLGVNTPETVDPRKAVECFGKDASSFSKSVLIEGSRIRLDEDAQADERDKYGRLLRNVVLADGTDFNAKLVAEGYAYAYTSFPLAPERKVELTRLQQEAKEAKRGLWGSTCR
jgi:micrococcal nuclease